MTEWHTIGQMKASALILHRPLRFIVPRRGAILSAESCQKNYYTKIVGKIFLSNESAPMRCQCLRVMLLHSQTSFCAEKPFLRHKIMFL